MSIVKEGDFKSLKIDKWELEMLEDAYQAVSESKRWGFLKREDVPGKNGFMFSDWPELKDINLYMGYGGHSGASYGWTMREMEYIAKKGWDAYVVLKGVKHQPQPLPKPEPQPDPPTQNIGAVLDFITTNPPIHDLNEFANAIQKDEGMRALIPDIDQQAEAMRKFASGKMSYAEMRSLCG